MTQRHTEKVVTMAFNARDGQWIQQRVSVNEQETKAAIFVSSRNYSATVLYDYRRKLIGIRTMNSSLCYVLRMERSQTPSIQDILTLMDNAKANNSSSGNEITYIVTPEQKADAADVGMGVNILCNNTDILWAKSMNPEHASRCVLIGSCSTTTTTKPITISISNNN
ncbi:surfactant protein C-like isoform X1 [Dendropsophus ebraccatus]|uniref:surfactant protein C-like isoform X1 n=1 Tax=Dendropsophus ebraccatus TaxID=150705 RepID=UPI0038321202